MSELEWINRNHESACTNISAAMLCHKMTDSSTRQRVEIVYDCLNTDCRNRMQTDGLLPNLFDEYLYDAYYAHLFVAHAAEIRHEGFSMITSMFCSQSKIINEDTGRL